MSLEALPPGNAKRHDSVATAKAPAKFAGPLHFWHQHTWPWPALCLIQTVAAVRIASHAEWFRPPTSAMSVLLPATTTSMAKCSPRVRRMAGRVERDSGLAACWQKDVVAAMAQEGVLPLLSQHHPGRGVVAQGVIHPCPGAGKPCQIDHDAQEWNMQAAHN